MTGVEESGEDKREDEDDGEVVTVKTMAGSANIIIADMIALNGVIHVIDNVIYKE